MNRYALGSVMDLNITRGGRVDASQGKQIINDLRFYTPTFSQFA